MINTAAQARTAVAASRFPPLGERGQGSPFSGMAWGLTTPEYLVQANEGVLVIIQIETLEGVDNVEEICAVPGVGESSKARACEVRDRTNFLPPQKCYSYSVDLFSVTS